MTSSSEALVYLLESNLTGVHAYPNVVPEGTIAPAIAYQMISDQPEMTQDGFANYQTTRYQITIEAQSYSQARGLARTIKRALNGYHGAISGLNVWSCVVENDMDDYSPTAMQPSARLDVLMQHDEH